MTDPRKSSGREYPPGLPISFGPRVTKREFEDRGSSTSGKSKPIWKDSILPDTSLPRGYATETRTKTARGGASPTGSLSTLGPGSLQLSRLNCGIQITLGSNCTNSTIRFYDGSFKKLRGTFVSVKSSDGTILLFRSPDGIISVLESTLHERTKLA